ncbi:odorant receptor 13a-like isoform X2 [Bombus vosnesenskii]|uniref:Odorant receptor n=2 Tax=Pyrobombus TaxID=144703 RepID=A0A6J3JXI3_9HYME|nr:odorant receptor 13a-like isoform X2 [Bombus vancouverensis nearcticus]XP_033299054.1 odorant receptor 13a-like isoform X2 [Bombus bifarius]XP_033345001.1 odorant receptor 13a-like isoform X2 [Bombus vosnesenskii]
MEMSDQQFSGKEYDELIKPIMITAKIISIWPLEEDSGKGTILFRRFHLFCMFLLAVVMSIAVTADVVHNIDDLNEATECALICTAFYLCVVRLLVYSLHQKDMFYVVKTMKEDWILSSHEDRTILAKKTMFAFRLAKYFISTVAMTIVLFMCIPFLEIYAFGSNERVLPFRGYFFVNHTISPVFECLYFFNVTAGGFGGSMIAGATSFNLVVIMHGSGKFAVLRKRLEALSGEDPNSTAILSNYVIRHQKAIEYADALERIINVLALGQFIISTGLICFAGFQITSMMKDKGRLMKYSTFLNSAILELFMFSFSGNGLIDESGAVGDSAYGSGWIGSRFSQSLQIMMMRARIPSKITAAKFYAMSLESFSAVLSTSFSYFTVLTATEGD